VLAHDFGGATVLRAALLNGLRYRSLTLVDPVAVAPWGSTFVQHVRQFEPAFAGLPDYAHCALLGAYLQTAAHSRLEETALAVYSAPWTGSPGQGAFSRQIAQMDQRFTDEIESLLPGLGCPVRLLWGENDTWIPVARGRKLAAMLGGVPLEIVRDSGHLMQEDRPEAIVAAMLG
jgi:pimeloyl-ACP methyl ester carboxylesterase